MPTAEDRLVAKIRTQKNLEAAKKIVGETAEAFTFGKVESEDVFSDMIPAERNLVQKIQRITHTKEFQSRLSELLPNEEKLRRVKGDPAIAEAQRQEAIPQLSEQARVMGRRAQIEEVTAESGVITLPGGVKINLGRDTRDVVSAGVRGVGSAVFGAANLLDLVGIPLGENIQEGLQAAPISKEGAESTKIKLASGIGSGLGFAIYGAGGWLTGLSAGAGLGVGEARERIKRAEQTLGSLSNTKKSFMYLGYGALGMSEAVPFLHMWGRLGKLLGVGGKLEAKTLLNTLKSTSRTSLVSRRVLVEAGTQALEETVQETSTGALKEFLSRVLGLPAEELDLKDDGLVGATVGFLFGGSAAAAMNLKAFETARSISPSQRVSLVRVQDSLRTQSDNLKSLKLEPSKVITASEGLVQRVAKRMGLDVVFVDSNKSEPLPTPAMFDKSNPNVAFVENGLTDVDKISSLVFGEFAHTLEVTEPENFNVLSDSLREVAPKLLKEKARLITDAARREKLEDLIVKLSGQTAQEGSPLPGGLLEVESVAAVLEELGPTTEFWRGLLKEEARTSGVLKNLLGLSKRASKGEAVSPTLLIEEAVEAARVLEDKVVDVTKEAKKAARARQQEEEALKQAVKATTEEVIEEEIEAEAGEAGPSTAGEATGRGRPAATGPRRRKSTAGRGPGRARDSAATGAATANEGQAPDRSARRKAVSEFVSKGTTQYRGSTISDIDGGGVRVDLPDGSVTESEDLVKAFGVAEGFAQETKQPQGEESVSTPEKPPTKEQSDAEGQNVVPRNDRTEGQEEQPQRDQGVQGRQRKPSRRKARKHGSPRGEGQVKKKGAQRETSETPVKDKGGRPTKPLPPEEVQEKIREAIEKKIKEDRPKVSYEVVSEKTGEVKGTYESLEEAQENLPDDHAIRPKESDDGTSEESEETDEIVQSPAEDLRVETEAYGPPDETAGETIEPEVSYERFLEGFIRQRYSEQDANEWLNYYNAMIEKGLSPSEANDEATKFLSLPVKERESEWFKLFEDLGPPTDTTFYSVRRESPQRIEISAHVFESLERSWLSQNLLRGGTLTHAFDYLFSRGTSAIERLGPAGKEIADGLRAISARSRRRSSRDIELLEDAFKGFNHNEIKVLGLALDGRRSLEEAEREMRPKNKGRVRETNKRVLEILDRSLKAWREVGGVRIYRGKKLVPLGSGRPVPRILNKEGRKTFFRARDLWEADPRVRAMIEKTARNKDIPYQEAKERLAHFVETMQNGRDAYLASTREIEIDEDLLEWDLSKILPPLVNKNWRIVEAARRWGVVVGTSAGIRFPLLDTTLKDMEVQQRAFSTMVSHARDFIYTSLGGKSTKRTPLTELGYVFDSLGYYETMTKITAPLTALRNMLDRYCKGLTTGTVMSNLQATMIYPPFMKVWLRAAHRLTKHLPLPKAFQLKTQAMLKKRDRVERLIAKAGAISATTELSDVGGAQDFFTTVGLASFKSAEVGNQVYTALVKYIQLKKDLQQLAARSGAKDPIRRVFQAVSKFSFETEKAILDRVRRSGVNDLTHQQMLDLINKGKLTQDEIVGVLHRAVNDNTFPITLATERMWYMSNPWYRLIFKFKTWPIEQIGFAYREAWHQAMLGNPSALVRFIGAHIVAGEIYNVIRDTLFDDDESLIRRMMTRPEGLTPKDIAGRLFADFIDGGGIGLIADITYGVTDLFAPPTLSTLERASTTTVEVFSNPKLAREALSDFAYNNISIAKQANEFISGVEEGWQRETSRTSMYYKWKKRIRDWRNTQDIQTTQEKITAYASDVLEGKFQSYKTTETSLPRRWAVRAINLKDIDAASTYMEEILRGAADREEKSKLIRSLKSTMSNSSPLSGVRKNETREFFKVYGSQQRRELLKFDAEWKRDYSKALQRAIRRSQK